MGALEHVGLPAIVRPSFTLGGTGGGVGYNREEFAEIIERGLDASPARQVLVEESVLGWKEFEMEVVRDHADNCIIVCSIENVDPDGRAHRRLDHRRAGADADRQGIPDHAQRLDRGAARDRGGDRRLQRAVRRQPGRRPPRRHRDEPARVALLGARLQGDRLPDRQGRGQARRRLHAGRARERHHRRRHARLLRAHHRLRRHQDPALRLREVSRRRAHADHLHEVGGRGDGDRAHVRREPAEGAARPGVRPDRARRHRAVGPGPGRRQERDPRRARHADAGPPAQGRPGHAPRRRPRADLHLLQDRSLVPDAHPGDRRHGGTRRGAWAAGIGRAVPRAQGDGLLGCAARQARGDERGGGARAPHRRSGSGRCSSASTRARPSSPRRPPTCTPPTSAGSSCRRRASRRSGRSTRPSPRRATRSSSSAAVPTASARASSSTTAAAMPPSRCRRPAPRPSWSTATPRRSRPTTTPPTGSTSSRSRPRTCSRSSPWSSRRAGSRA